MLRAYNVRVYLILYFDLILQITSTNGLAIPLSRPIPASMPRRLTNSSLSAVKNLPSVLTSSYCELASSVGNAKTDEYVRGLTNHKIVNLDSGKPVIVKPSSRPSSAAVFRPSSTSAVKSVQPKRLVGSSYSDKTFKNSCSNSSLAKTIAYPNYPLLLTTLCDPPSLKPSPTIDFCCKNEHESSWNNRNGPSLQDFSGSSIRMNTVPKSAMNPIKNSVSFSPSVVRNKFAERNVNDLTFRPFPVQVGSSNFNLRPYPQIYPSNFLADLVATAPIQNVNSVPLVQNTLFSPDDVKTFCNPFLAAVDLQNKVQGTDDTSRTVSNLTPLSSDLFCAKNNFSHVGSKFKVKSMELKILPIPLLADNTIQGTVMPLISNKTLSCSSVSNTNIEANRLTAETIYLNNFYLANSADLKLLSSSDEGTQGVSPKVSFNIQSPPSIQNTPSPSNCFSPPIDISLCYCTPLNLILDIFKTISLERPLSPSNETLSRQINFTSESLKPSTYYDPVDKDVFTKDLHSETAPSIKNLESDSLYLVSSELQSGMDFKSTSDIPNEHIFLTGTPNDSNLVIEDENVNISSVMNNNIEVNRLTAEYISSNDSADPKLLSSSDEGSQEDLPKVSCTIQSPLSIQNTSLPSDCVSAPMDRSLYYNTPLNLILDTFKATSLESPFSESDDTLLGQINCASESLTPSMYSDSVDKDVFIDDLYLEVSPSIQNSESDKLFLASAELQKETDSAIPNELAFLKTTPIDLNLLIENEHAKILPTMLPDDFISETSAIDTLSSSELPLFKEKHSSESESNVLQPCLSFEILPCSKVHPSLDPTQASVSEMYIPSEDFSQALQISSEQMVPIYYKTPDGVPLPIVDILVIPTNTSLSLQLLYLYSSSYPLIYDMNNFYTDSPISISHVPTDYIAPSSIFPNNFLNGVIDIIPFEQSFILDVPLTDIANYITDISVSTETLPSNIVDVILLPDYIEHQSFVDDILKIDKIPSTYLVPCTIIESDAISNSSVSPVWYDVTPYFVSNDTLLSNVLTPVSYLLDHQPNIPYDINEPIYFEIEDFNSPAELNDFYDSLLVSNFPYYLDSSLSIPTSDIDVNIFSDSVSKLNNENDFPEVLMSSNFEVLPIVKYVTSAYKQSPNINNSDGELLNNLLSQVSKESVPSIETILNVSLPCVQSNFRSTKFDCNSKPTKSRRQNTKRHSRKNSSKSKTNVALVSPSEDITDEVKLLNGDSFVTVSDKPYTVSILQNSLDTLSSKEFDDCAFYNTVSLGLTSTPLPVVKESKHNLEITSACNSKIPLFKLDSITSSMTSDLMPLNDSFDDDFSDVEKIAHYIVLKELLYSNSQSNWDLLGKIVDILCSDHHEN